VASISPVNTSILGEKLLIVDDRLKDLRCANYIATKTPFWSPDNVESVRSIDEAKSKLATRQFAFLITDLYLLPPEKADEIDNLDAGKIGIKKFTKQYYRTLDLATRLDLMEPLKADGLHLIRSIREGELGDALQKIPIIVFTFFWQHSRFVEVIDKIEQYNPPVGYLPKFFRGAIIHHETDAGPWFRPAEGYEDILRKGINSLELMINLLRVEYLPDELKRNLNRMIFYYLSAELKTRKHNFLLEKAIHSVAQSYDDLFKQVCQFHVTFCIDDTPSEDLQMAPVKYLEAHLSMPEIRTSVEIEVRYFEGDAKLVNKKETLLQFGRASAQDLPLADKQLLFKVLFMLCRYTHPSVPDTIGLTTENLAEMFSLNKVSNTVIQLRKLIDDKLIHTNLPPRIRDFISADRHVLVEEESSYYFNGSSEVVWMSDIESKK